MLYVFYGEKFWIKEKIKELSARAKEKGREVLVLEEGIDTPLNSFLSRDLFGRKILVIGQSLLEIPEREEEIKALAPDMSSSENIFILAEGELSESFKKIFSKAGAKTQEFKKYSPARLSAWISSQAKALGVSPSPSDLNILISETDGDPFAILNKLERWSLEKNRAPALRSFSGAGEPNYFNFADAVSGKKKYQALSLLRSYIKDGFGAEEAFWKFWWKIKTMRLVDSLSAQAGGKKITGLHQFVEKKAREDIRNFSKDELKKISLDLLDLFSKTRRGEENYEEGLEKIITRF